MRRRPKAPPHGPSANTPYPFARTFAPPPHCHRTTCGRSGAAHLTCRRCRRRSSCSRCGGGGAPSRRPAHRSCRPSRAVCCRRPINSPQNDAIFRRKLLHYAANRRVRSAGAKSTERARRGQRSCPRLARSVGSSANHAKQIGRTSPAFHRTDFATHPARPRTDSPAFYRTNFARAPARQSDGLTFGIPSPAFPRTYFARIRKPDADSTISQPRYGRNQPPRNHEPTILRVEYKNDTISTKPSYISDSPNQTAIQQQFNLNHPSPASQPLLNYKKSAAKLPRCYCATAIASKRAETPHSFFVRTASYLCKS